MTRDPRADELLRRAKLACEIVDDKFHQDLADELQAYLDEPQGSEMRYLDRESERATAEEMARGDE
jgi:hypothetical protein